MLGHQIIVRYQCSFRKSSGARAEQQSCRCSTGQLLFVKSDPVLFTVMQKLGPWYISLRDGLSEYIEDAEIRSGNITFSSCDLYSLQQLRLGDDKLCT